MPDDTKAPYTFDIQFGNDITLSSYDSHIIRRLSSMQGQFLDRDEYQRMLNVNDALIYEVYELHRPEVPGELMQGISIVHPGKVGAEYFMTKGHFHTVLDTGEVYYCLRGQGFMVMEDPQGEWSIEPLRPNSVLYVPPRWAHRTVNTGEAEDLVTFFVYPGNAGHDYGSIEKQGYRKLVLERGGNPEIVDNPRWLSPEER